MLSGKISRWDSVGLKFDTKEWKYDKDMLVEICWIIYLIYRDLKLFRIELIYLFVWNILSVIVVISVKCWLDGRLMDLLEWESEFGNF